MSSSSEEKNLYWASDTFDNLISAIQKLRKNLQAKTREKWRMSFFHPPELVEPLQKIGFEVDSHYVDYWLYGIAKLELDVPEEKKIRKAVPNDFDRLTEISTYCLRRGGWKNQKNGLQVGYPMTKMIFLSQNQKKI